MGGGGGMTLSDPSNGGMTPSDPSNVGKMTPSDRSYGGRGGGG